MRKMLERQLKGMPKEEQEKIITLVTKNPDLFQKIAMEIQEKVKTGKGQTEAAMEVMKAHQAELSAIMSKQS